MSALKTVFIDGIRTPFLRSGTEFNDYMAYDLAREAISALLDKTGVEPGSIEHVVLGNVIQEIQTSNVAREASLAAGIPQHVPSHTIAQACISANQATATIADKIQAGQIGLGLSGGTETMSDVPIRVSRPLRKILLKSQKVRSFGQYLGLLRQMKLKYLTPELPAIAEFSSGETMGKSSDRLAAHFGITRQAQDEYALRSHKLAHEATEKGFFKDEICPVFPKKDGKAVYKDNGIRGDSTMEKLSKLKPAFIKPHGTITAGNASFLTDGASAALFASEEKAKQLGLKPKARIVDYIFVAQDPNDELLLGPSYATPKILKKTGLSFSDIGVIEFHEAFAGQILANLAALSSKSFMNKAGYDQTFDMDMSLFNTWGGSLAIGHPFGATGTRLITTAANRLHREDKQFALLAACAAGGQGHAMILERI